ncbi:MAG: acyltransferase [Candidatus Bathyarchaeota archaeon]|nr:acyltransferase [Candidatus Bathyarchaeota archaeon]
MLEKTQTLNTLPRRSIVEFNYLKVVALFLLLFVHSDLIFSHPEIIYPVQWFLLSAFFFVSGFLAYNSFLKRQKSLRRFFKSKAKKLYVPFLIATIFYFLMQVAMGATADSLKLISQVSMLNIFDELNTIYNWGALWFIPYLLVFMLIICSVEKYVKSLKAQLLIVSLVWLTTILLWVFASPLRLGELFSQFLIVFLVGFYVNKLNMYERIMNYKTAFLSILLVAVFSFDFSEFFNYSNPAEAFKASLYLDTRIIMLTMGLVLIMLLFFRKAGVGKNGFIKEISSRSAFIYLSEPFLSFLILSYLFNKPDNVLFTDGAEFYLYQVVRVLVFFVLIPFTGMALKKAYEKRNAANSRTIKPQKLIGQTI